MVNKHYRNDDYLSIEDIIGDRVNEIVAVLPMARSTFLSKVRSGEFPQPRIIDQVEKWRYGDIKNKPPYQNTNLAYYRLRDIIGLGVNKGYQGSPLVDMSSDDWWAGVNCGLIPNPVKTADGTMKWRRYEIHELVKKIKRLKLCQNLA